MWIIIGVLIILTILVLSTAAVSVYGYRTKSPKVGVHEKTFWDWLSILIVPVLLTLGGIQFAAYQDIHRQAIENQRTKTQQEIENERARDAAMQTYLDRIGSLMLSHNLRNAEEGDVAYALARARTSAVIASLDASHNKSVTRFLGESGLTGAEETGLRGAEKSSVSIVAGIDLRNADLSGTHLTGADLRGTVLVGANLRSSFLLGADLTRAALSDANLEGAYLQQATFYDTPFGNTNLSDAELEGANIQAYGNADFSRADLREANLSRASLYKLDGGGDRVIGSDFREADLSEADLSGADLRKADFTGARLVNANLTYTNLTEATITGRQLAQAESLAGAAMPDGTILKGIETPEAPTFEDWLKNKGRGGEDGEISGSS